MNESKNSLLRPSVLVTVCLLGVVVALLLLGLRHKEAPAPVVEPVAVAAPAAREPLPEMKEIASYGASPEMSGNNARVALREKWGIEIKGIHLSVGGNALDVRYRVVDIDKAGRLATNLFYTYVMDQNTGKNLLERAPFQPLVAQEMSAGKTYAAFIPNKGRAVKSGTTVSLLVGGVRSQGLIVE